MLDAALAEALAANDRIGFLTQVQVDRIDIDWSDGARLTGQGAWINTTGSGARGLPDVAFEGRVPTSAWQWGTDGLRVTGVEIDAAMRLAFGTTPARPEPPANQAGWADKLGDLLARSGPYAVVGPDAGDWAIGSVTYDTDAVRVTLVPR